MLVPSLNKVAAFHLPVLRWWRSVREFHAYHGIWALGVRLLRQWSIRAKILIVLAIVVVPVLPLALFVVQALTQTVVDSVRHQASLRVASAASDLGVELNRQWQAMEAGRPADEQALRARYESLVAVLAEPEAAALGSMRAWRDGRDTVRRAALERGVSLASRLESAGKGIRVLLELRREVVAAGGVSMSGNETLNRTATLALELLPDLQQSIGALRTLAARQTLGGRNEPQAAAEAHRTLVAVAGQSHDIARLTAAAESRLLYLPVGVAPTAQRSLPRSRAMLDRLPSTLLAHEPNDDRRAVLALMAEATNEVATLRTSLLEATRELTQARLVQARDQRSWVLGLLAAGLVLAFYLFYTFYLVMRGGLKTVNQQMGRLAQGDLTARPAPRGGDEVAEALRAMTLSLARLSDLLATVRNGVGAVTQAAQQVAGGNADLAVRNRRSAGGLEDVVSAVMRYTEQLLACGRQVEGVVGTVQELRLDAARNRKQMERLQERMGSLRVKSREIGDIVRLIDAIAFRTNILALNASVEASKAGEAGRGFAVVAQEVRSLAMRSAESARRIDDIVTRSTEDIERSGDLVDETGRTLTALDQHVDQIHAAMRSVSELTRSGEQDSAQILQEVQELKAHSATDQLLVEQLTAASNSLRSQGERLSHSIGQFKLG